MATIELGGTGSYGFSGDHARMYVTYSNGVLKLSGATERIHNLIPTVYQMGDNFRRVFTAAGLCLEKLDLDRQDADAQRYIQTATWGLRYWEAYYNLPVQLDNTDYDARRETVLAAARALEDESETTFEGGLSDLISGAPLSMTMKDPHRNKFEFVIEVGIDYLLETPATAPVAADAGAGTIPAGTYTYQIAYANSSGETVVSPTSNSVVLGSSKNILLTDIPVGPEDVQSRKVYRKETGDPAFGLVATITNNFDTTYLDTAAAGGAAPVGTTTARTLLGSAVDLYIANTKPAHINVTVASTGFRADIDEADLDAV